jgi:hypothetical protein
MDHQLHCTKIWRVKENFGEIRIQRKAFAECVESKWNRSSRTYTTDEDLNLDVHPLYTTKLVYPLLLDSMTLHSVKKKLWRLYCTRSST